MVQLSKRCLSLKSSLGYRSIKAYLILSRNISSLSTVVSPLIVVSDDLSSSATPQSLFFLIGGWELSLGPFSFFFWILLRQPWAERGASETFVGACLWHGLNYSAVGGWEGRKGTTPPTHQNSDLLLSTPNTWGRFCHANIFPCPQVKNPNPNLVFKIAFLSNITSQSNPDYSFSKVSSTLLIIVLADESLDLCCLSGLR